MSQLTIDEAREYANRMYASDPLYAEARALLQAEADRTLKPIRTAEPFAYTIWPVGYEIPEGSPNGVLIMYAHTTGRCLWDGCTLPPIPRKSTCKRHTTFYCRVLLLRGCNSRDDWYCNRKVREEGGICRGCKQDGRQL